ncbi:MAG: 3,5-nucleoside bisphosphate phosphatase [Acidimicrobiaceae bacterium]|nr:3,5-nucleoside bisphosphate phosphatase [Acidimicrobiaceae bacterium]
MIDLHTHSTASDGSDQPARIAEMAAQAGCTAFALTDHDGLDGIFSAGARAAELSVRFVPGCEISCPHPGTLHLLVYFVEPGEGPLQDELIRLQQIRDLRNRELVTRLAGMGLPVTYEEVQAEAGGTGAGRPHMAAVLVRKGAAASVQDAFDRYLAKGRPGYVEKERLPVDHAVRLAQASGGVVVLAHPLSLNLTSKALEAEVEGLAAAGVQGVEALYGRYSPQDRAGLAELAARHGLVATGGSDHHGAYKPDLAVGVGTGDLDVPDDVLDRLTDRRP